MYCNIKHLISEKLENLILNSRYFGKSAVYYNTHDKVTDTRMY